MAGSLSRVFTAINNPNLGAASNIHAPMLNSLTTSFNTYLSEVGQIRKKKRLMAWFKGIPELTALANKVAKDITHKWHFETIDPKDSGRNKILKANKFSQGTEIKKIMRSQVIDILGLGEGYGWKGKLSKEQLKKEVTKLLSNEIFLSNYEKKEVSNRVLSELKQDFEEGFTGTLDEDATLLKKYRYLPSSTVEIIHDQFNILEYNHVVGGKNIVFTKDEIIRYTFQEIDGRVGGFTPVESIVVQLELLRQMWQNMMSVYKNGGSPDKLFILENTRVNDPAYKRIEEQLKKYKLVENQHGNMLFTGKVTVQDLQQLDQMQFKDMGLYITGLMAMQWEIPRSSIPYILGGTNTQEDTGGNSERGYWTNVESFQEQFAETMNAQLWIPHFGVKIVFDSPFIQKDVQAQTALQLKLGNVKALDEALGAEELMINKAKRLKLLGLCNEDVVKKKVQPMMPGQMPGQQLDNQSVNDPQSKRNLANRKREEQLNSIQSRGMAPTGVGKEMDKPAELEYKNLIGTDDFIHLSMDQFIKIYTQERMKIGEPPRIFMRQNIDTTSFMFKGVDFPFKSAIGTRELDLFRVKLMNLGSDIFKL
jgi:hypothetical protein